MITDMMVEAAARALCRHEGKIPDALSRAPDGELMWQRYIAAARAALEAAERAAWQPIETAPHPTGGLMTTHEELVEAVAQSIPGAPVRLQLSRAKGLDLQALSLATNGLPALNVSRPSKLGNPFMCTPDGCLRRMTEAQGGYRCCVDVYREYLLSGIEGRPSYTGAFRAMLDGMAGYPERARMIAALPKARGKNLACWCAIVDQHGNYVPCHADVLLSVANGISCEEVRDENIRRAEGKADR